MPSVADRIGPLLADADNNIWIPPYASSGSRAVSRPAIYDVVNKERGIIDRVMIPEGKTLVGFGPKGVLYLLGSDGGKLQLLRATAR